MSGATPEPRTAVMILVEASWMENSGTLQSVTARMENRSAHGACIRIKAKVGVGARVHIRSHREQFSGIAKYCRVEGKEFLVGIQRDAVSWPMPKGPMPASGPNRDTGRRAERAKGNGFPPRSGQVKASKSVVSEACAARDAEWMAGRKSGPRRDSVPNRGTGPRVDREEGTTLRRDSVQADRAPTAVEREFIARIEEPIAARLMKHDERRAESPSAMVANVAPVDAVKVAQQVLAGNGFEEKKEKKPAKKGRGFMKLKWFAGDEEELLQANGGNNPPKEPAQRAAEAAPRMERLAVARSAATPAGESGGGFETELLPVEDIYRAAGITSPRRGYSIGKVVEMLRSEHLRGASRELRRAAVLMALDAAGVTVDEVLQDAKVRQEAIDAYAAEQRKHAEAQWSRKAEENLQIQAELELVKAHYGERIRRNLDGVAREKATFGSWLKAKEQETQGMAEAVEQVLKAPAPSEPPADPLLSVTVSSVTGKPV